MCFYYILYININTYDINNQVSSKIHQKTQYFRFLPVSTRLSSYASMQLCWNPYFHDHTDFPELLG